MRPLPLRSGGGRGGIFCRRLIQHHKCKLFGMVEIPSKGRKVPKNAIFMCDVKTYISTSYLVWFQTIFSLFFELSSIQRKFWLIISYLQGYGTVVPVSLLVSPIRPTERFRNRVFIKALYAWRDAFICWARCCRKVQKFGVLKNTYISKLADGIIGEFLEKSPKFLFWNLLIADIQSSKGF